MNDLEYKLEKISDKLTLLETPQSTKQFSEQFHDVPEFAEGDKGFKNLGIMALGGAIAPIASNVLNKFIPVGSLGSVLVGAALKFMVKNNTVQRVGDGMIISGLSVFISNLLAGKVGFGEGGFSNNDDDVAFSEQRIGSVNFG